MNALTLDITVGEYYAPEMRDKDHTSFVVKTSTIVFEDPEDAISYLVDYKGISQERAEKVIARRCEFQIDSEDEALGDRQFKIFKFRKDAK